MEDFATQFLQGLQAGQQVRQRKLAEQQEAEDRSIQKMLLQHKMRELKIAEKLQARQLAQQNLGLMNGQPQAALPADITQTPELAGTPENLTKAVSGQALPPVGPIARAPVTIPGVSELGVGDTQVRPQSMEEGMLQRVKQAMATAQTTPYNLAPGAKRMIGDKVIAENPRVTSPGSLESQYLEALRRGDKEEMARITQARKAVGQADDRPPTMGGMDTLYGLFDPKAVADAIEAGEQPPTVSDLGRPMGAAVRSELAKRGFNLSTAQSDWAATQSHFRTLNGSQQTRLRQAAETAYHSLDVIDDLSEKWKGGRFPILNKANLAAAKAGAYGKDAQSIAVQLEAQITDVASEMANVYMGGNSPTDHALKLAAKNLSADWSKDTLKGATDLARKNLRIRLNSIQQTGVIGASPTNPYVAPPQAQGRDPLGIR